MIVRGTARAYLSELRAEFHRLDNRCADLWLREGRTPEYLGLLGRREAFWREIEKLEEEGCGVDRWGS